jgi:hypothetical protein
VEIKSKQEQLLSYRTKHTLSKNSVRRDNGPYLLLKGTIQQEDIIILNIYAANIGVLKIIIKCFEGSDTITVGDLNAPLTSIDRTS